jgi:hypothetical protein
MQMVTEEYRGYEITYPGVRIDAARFIVNLASNDPHLAMKLTAADRVIIDHGSLEGAVQQAKKCIDNLLS